MLFCPSCDTKRWATPAKAGAWQCCKCYGAINATKALAADSARKKAARAAKAGRAAPDQDFMRWVAQMPCRICNNPPPSHAHHSVHRSQGGSDRTCLPLCHYCHSMYHTKLGSVAAAKDAWGIDMPAEAEALSREFDALADDALE